MIKKTLEKIRDFVHFIKCISNKKNYLDFELIKTLNSKYEELLGEVNECKFEIECLKAKNKKGAGKNGV